MGRGRAAEERQGRTAPAGYMDPAAIALENDRLRQSWDCFSAAHLADYLSVGEQDPRINTHSILNRALLADALQPGRFDALIDAELRFGVVMTWLLEQLKAGADRCALLDDLDDPAASARAVPEVVRTTVAWLREEDCPVPDYVAGALAFAPSDGPEAWFFEPPLNTFADLWASELAGLDAARPSVLEAACGSGGDHRAICACGLGAHIDYAGFDLCGKNVANACSQFPDARFFEASVLDSGLPDRSFDIVFAHDIIGHLSAAGMERALAELVRIARREVWIHAYNAADIPRHEIRPFELYHRNRLSIPRLSASLTRAGAEVEVVVLSDLLRRKFGCEPPYTATSASFLARRRDA